jgi:3-hydroxyisobutyrate dehydrogenase-like beta-hydroxyacid dehydrogenase
MAKLCYENGLTKGPDILSYTRLSTECLLLYIITSQAEAERSAEKKGVEQQQQLQIKKEGSVEQHDLDNYHTMTASSSSSSRAAAAITTNTATKTQHLRRSPS